MQTLDKKKEGFAQKQIECLDKAGKFERFLKDGEAKRRKAIVKYQTEAKQNGLRQTELDELAIQLGGMRARQQKLHEKMSKNTIYEDFLIKIVDNVPENYLEHGVDSPVRAIIRRHETLSITNESLVNSLTTLADEQERKQYQLETLQRRHDTSKLVMSLRAHPYSARLLSNISVASSLISTIRKQIFRHPTLILQQNSASRV
ncbi:hypothetical protein FKM82_017132 [Ascaphus truei]